jgi:hypothetical protein
VTRTAALLALAGAALPAAIALQPADGSPPLHAARTQTTTLISRSASGGVPNGPSTRPVISGDRRYARMIAFESTASNLAHDDTNGRRDVFAIERKGSFANEGTPWQGGRAILVSRGRNGKPANGRSWAPDVDGSFRDAAHCVAFLSKASNLVSGDTNGKADAFLATDLGHPVERVSLPDDRQSSANATAVAVSGDCSHTAFVAGGKLYTRAGGHTRRVDAPAHAADPSFAQGETNDLVFGASGGVYLSKGGTGDPRKVGDRGRNPAYNALKRRVVAYEKRRAGHVQLVWHDLGKSEQIASRGESGAPGDGDSRDPVVVNSGYFIGFESDASNLGGGPGPHAYLYTDTRKLTQVRSVDSAGDPLPGGGRHPGVSYYANYIVFSSPAPVGATGKPDQVFMRYLGGK